MAGSYPVSRPYHIVFETCIQKTKKLYIDSHVQRNINTEYQGVQRVMVANTEGVLRVLSALDSKTNNLSSLSKKYSKDAKNLNLQFTYAKLVAAAVFSIMLIVCLSDSGGCEVVNPVTGKEESRTQQVYVFKKLSSKMFMYYNRSVTAASKDLARKDLS